VKVALVTGASRGLGAAIAFALSEAGWAVAVNYAHDDEGAARTLNRIKIAGRTAASFRFDVTNPARVADGIAEIASGLGPVDLIVNNASGPQGAHPIMEQDWSVYQEHIEMFVKAPLTLLQATLPDWRARRTGRVINIGSEVTEVGSPFDAHYVAAKAAMIGITRSWASELGPEGITVNIVSPGWVPVERHTGTSSTLYEEHLHKVPLGRVGLPEEVAGTVVFVASSAANYITGHNFVVNGGRTYS
jgi:3-oxoacyl-[acyl-carrier protein] reductase